MNQWGNSVQQTLPVIYALLRVDAGPTVTVVLASRLYTCLGRLIDPS